MEERRGRPKEQTTEEQPRKFTRIYEDEDAIETWFYDLDKFHGPINVEIKYKPGAEKRIKERVKENKQIKKTERQMKKIQSKQSPKTTKKATSGKRGRPKKTQ